MCVWLFLNLLAGNPTTVLLKQPAGICYTERRTVHLSICHQVLNKRIATEIHARNILYICRERETQALLKEWFSCGIWFALAMRALVKSNSDDGWSGPAHSPHSSSSQRCWIGSRSELCAEHSNGRSTPNWDIYFFMDLALCVEALSFLNRRGTSTNNAELAEQHVINHFFRPSHQSQSSSIQAVAWSDCCLMLPDCGLLCVGLRTCWERDASLLR